MGKDRKSVSQLQSAVTPNPPTQICVIETFVGAMVTPERAVSTYIVIISYYRYESSDKITVLQCAARSEDSPVKNKPASPVEQYVDGARFMLNCAGYVAVSMAGLSAVTVFQWY